MNGWKISDRIRTHVLTAENYFVQPKSYLVISTDSLLRQKYNASFDLLTAALPQLNNDGDMVVITDSLGVVIDSIVYTPSMGGTNGRSLERLYLDSSSTAPTNWATSTAKANATPGAANTASPKKYDLSLISFAPAKTGFVESDSIIFNLKIKNYGTETASGYGLSIFNDANGDLLTQGSELIKQVSISGGIASKDSVIAEIKTAPFGAGKYSFIAVVNYVSDEDSLNNSSECAVTVYKTEVPAHDIVINEIMFEPASGNPEWIELQNISKDTVNLKNCTVGDVLSTPHTTVITTKDYSILPGDYVILSSDTLSSFYG